MINKIILVDNYKKISYNGGEKNVKKEHKKEHKGTVSVKPKRLQNCKKGTLNQAEAIPQLKIGILNSKKVITRLNEV